MNIMKRSLILIGMLLAICGSSLVLAEDNCKDVTSCSEWGTSCENIVKPYCSQCTIDLDTGLIVCGSCFQLVCSDVCIKEDSHQECTPISQDQQVPEFSTIAGAIALVGALGIVVYRRR